MRPTDAFRALLAVMFFTILPMTMGAQSPDGVVSGIVVDSDGRVIPEADVLTVNDATAVRYLGKTNREGIYSIPNLPPGQYRIQLSKRGFKTLIKPDVIINTHAVLAINFTLPVGATLETLTVEGGAPLIQTESASVSTVIDRQFVENLPLNGRSFNTLMQLTPGVVIAQQPSGTAGGSAPGQFSIGGQRTDANSFTVDGVSANFGVSANGLYSGASGTGSSQAFSALGGTSSLVSAEALQEFRIETSSFAPEFGRTPGGQVILTTRSGTNRLTGEAYEYFRNDVMDANDWFANNAGRPRAAERHNDFGGVVGGPIVRKRTFFFFSYEGARLRLPQTSLIQVPYLNDSNCKPSSAILPFLNAYPKPNGPVAPTSCTGQFTGSYSNSATLNATSLRIDHNISSRFSVFARYNYAPSVTTSRVYSLSSLQDGVVNTQTGTVGLNSIAGNSAVNSLRFNYSSQTANSIQRQDSYGGAMPIDPALIVGPSAKPDAFGSFQTSDTSYYSIGPVSKNQARQINVVDDFNVAVRSHQLKFGVDYRAIYLDKTPHSTTISLTSSSVSNLIAGGKATQLSGVVNAPSSFRTTSISLYAQDTWKVSPRVTLTYGARWELAPAPTPLGTTKAASWQNVQDPAHVTLAPFGTPLWAMTYGNIAPRFGIAWKPTQDGSTVLRAGFGAFYDLGVGRAADVASFFPGQANASYQNVPMPIVNPSQYLPAFSLSPPYPNVSAFSPDLELPRSYQWNLALERSFKGRQAASVTYVGQYGADLLRQAASYKPNPNFSGAFLLTSNTAWSTYNALQLQYKVPLVGGFQALVNYTFAHSLDNSSNDVVAGLADSVISAASDYASSDYDVRQSFSAAVTYTVPSTVGAGLTGALTRSWSISSVIVARSGFPFNGRVLSLSSVTGGYVYSRPDRIRNQPVWIANSQAAAGKMLNTAALVVPTSLRQGTESRNDIHGFNLAQMDLSLGRRFPIHDRLDIAIRADAFNLFNHPNFANPSDLIGYSSTNLQSTQMLNSALGGLNPLFQEGGPRSLQLSLKAPLLAPFRTSPQPSSSTRREDLRPNHTKYVWILSLLTQSCLAWQCPEGKRTVTVKDAIEMTRLGTAAYQDDTASAAAKFSPDGKRFAVVLKRGNLERDVNEYQLLVFKTNQALKSQTPEFSTTLSSASNREAIKGIKWLRDNRTLMFIGEHGNSSQVFSLDVLSRTTRQVTHSRTPIVLFDASADGKTIVYEADAGEENPLAKPDIRRNGVVVSGQDLADLVLSATPSSYFPTRKSRELFVQRAGEAPRRIETSDGITPNLALSVAPNGKYALVEAWVHDVPAEWFDYKDPLLHEFITADRSKGANALVEQYLILNTANGAVAPLINAPKSWEHNGFHWIFGGDSIVLSRAYLPLTGIDAEEKQRRASGKYLIEVDPGKHSIVKIAEGALIAQAWSEEAHTLTLSEKDHEANGFRTIILKKAGNSWTPAESDSHSQRILPVIRYEQDMNTPPRITISNPETKETKTLIDLNPHFKDLCFATEREIHWMATDKHPIQGGLYLPPDFHPGHRYPLVIQTHAFDPQKFWIDGPWSSAFAAQPLAARGIAVLQIGGASDGSDTKFRSTPMEAPRQMAVFEGAVDYLDQGGIIDRDRVGIIGFSRTGYHVAYTLTHSRYHWASATLADCFTGGFFAEVAFRNGISEPNAVNGGPPYGQTLSLWLDRSPSFLMTKLETPVRLESYGLASAIEQWEWFSLSSQLKKPVDFIVLPGGVHVLVRPSDRYVSQQGNVDWFDYWLNRKTDRSPTKHDQYTRWEELRDLTQPPLGHRSR